MCKTRALYSWPLKVERTLTWFAPFQFFFFSFTSILLRNHWVSRSIKADVHSQTNLPGAHNTAKLPLGHVEEPLSGACHLQPHPLFNLKWLLPAVPIALCFVLGVFNLSAKSWTQLPDLAWATEESWQGNGIPCLAWAQTSSTEANISISTLAALWVR